MHQVLQRDAAIIVLVELLEARLETFFIYRSVWLDISQNALGVCSKHRAVNVTLPRRIDLVIDAQRDH